MAIYYSKVYVSGQTYTDGETGMNYGYDIYFANTNTDYDYTGEVWYAGCEATNRNYIKKIFATNPVYDEGYNPTGEYTFNINIDDPSALFAGCMNTSIPNLNRIKVMSSGLVSLFRGCPNLETLDLSTGDLSTVKAIDYMFEGCTSLREVNIENWNVSNIWACERCFANCPNLSSIKATSGTDWQDQMDLGGWETRVDDIFVGSTSLPSFDSSNTGIYAANDRLPDEYGIGGYFRHDWEYREFKFYEKFEDNWVEATGKIKDSTWKDVVPKMLEY